MWPVHIPIHTQTVTHTHTLAAQCHMSQSRTKISITGATRSPQHTIQAVWECSAHSLIWLWTLNIKNHPNGRCILFNTSAGLVIYTCRHYLLKQCAIRSENRMCRMRHPLNLVMTLQLVGSVMIKLWPCLWKLNCSLATPCVHSCHCLFKFKQ